MQTKTTRKENGSVALERGVDVLLAEGSGLASRGHELVVSVDALHVLHDTWCTSQIYGQVN